MFVFFFFEVQLAKFIAQRDAKRSVRYPAKIGLVKTCAMRGGYLADVLRKRVSRSETYTGLFIYELFA